MISVIPKFVTSSTLQDQRLYFFFLNPASLSLINFSIVSQFCWMRKIQPSQKHAVEKKKLKGTHLTISHLLLRYFSIHNIATTEIKVSSQGEFPLYKKKKELLLSGLRANCLTCALFHLPETSLVNFWVEGETSSFPAFEKHNNLRQLSYFMC